jgi:hypothetical protein
MTRRSKHGSRFRANSIEREQAAAAAAAAAASIDRFITLVSHKICGMLPSLSSQDQDDRKQTIVYAANDECSIIYTTSQGIF